MPLFCIALTDSESYRGQLSGQRTVPVWIIELFSGWPFILLSHVNVYVSFPPCLMTLSGPQWNLPQLHRTADKITDPHLCVRDSQLHLTQGMTLVEYVSEPWLQEPPRSPISTQCQLYSPRGKEIKGKYHFGKSIADVRKLPPLSDGVQKEQSGQCSVDTACPLTVHTDWC